jgi:hypothetical protein
MQRKSILDSIKNFIKEAKNFYDEQELNFLKLDEKIFPDDLRKKCMEISRESDMYREKDELSEVINLIESSFGNDTIFITKYKVYSDVTREILILFFEFCYYRMLSEARSLEALYVDHILNILKNLSH